MTYVVRREKGQGWVVWLRNGTIAEMTRISMRHEKLSKREAIQSARLLAGWRGKVEVE